MKRNIRLLLVFLAFAALAYAGYFWWTGRASAASPAPTISGTMDATEIRISALAAGRVKSVWVAEGDSVQAGQPLIQLDDTLLQARRRQAEATLAAANGTASAAEARPAHQK